MLDTNTHIVNAVEEESVLKLQGLVLLFDVVECAKHLLVSPRHKVVYDEETAELIPVEDEKILDAVFNEFCRIFEEEEAEDIEG
jgi:hypothetical protein